MGRATKAFLLVISFLLTLLAQPADAVSDFDQEQSAIDNTRGGITIGGDSAEKLSQVVTTRQTGALRAVEVAVGCNSPSDLTLEIRGVGSDGEPNSVSLTPP